jgi:hypothetical protein
MGSHPAISFVSHNFAGLGYNKIRKGLAVNRIARSRIGL